MKGVRLWFLVGGCWVWCCDEVLMVLVGCLGESVWLVLVVLGVVVAFVVFFQRAGGFVFLGGRVLLFVMG